MYRHQCTVDIDGSHSVGTVVTHLGISIYTVSIDTVILLMAIPDRGPLSGERFLTLFSFRLIPSTVRFGFDSLFLTYPWVSGRLYHRSLFEVSPVLGHYRLSSRCLFRPFSVVNEDPWLSLNLVLMSVPPSLQYPLLLYESTQ